MLNRRQLLQGLGAGAALAGAGARAFAAAATAPDVLVIGAGGAGLVAAKELLAKGVSVIVLVATRGLREQLRLLERRLPRF